MPDSITFNRSEGRIGKAVLNDSGKDRTTVVADNSYFGIVSGMTTYNSADPNQRSVPYRSGYAQDWLDADTATSGDYWSYVTRGVAWDYHMAAYYRYPYYGDTRPTRSRPRRRAPSATSRTTRGRSRSTAPS